mmetsp:Transcript_4168/g.8059  ORF Transcript_4168/g.8059 Transcript_4168/m.8059 type:complete len:92 (+) Transcript_4168:212-487(+)
MNNSSGIQELMAAETRASQIVAEARIGRGERMKQAKSDAQELIDAYRGEKQEEFNARVLTAGESTSIYTHFYRTEGFSYFIDHYRRKRWFI